MTRQITIKLNYDLFRPLLDQFKNFAGGILTSDSDIAAKCIYFVHFFMNSPTEIGKTRFEIVTATLHREKAEGIVLFLSEYYKFKKTGLKQIKK
jgi:hypothetical protein